MILEQIHRLIGTRAVPDVLGHDAGRAGDVVLPMRGCAERDLFDQSTDVDRLLARARIAGNLFPAIAIRAIKELTRVTARTVDGKLYLSCVTVFFFALRHRRPPAMPTTMPISNVRRAEKYSQPVK